MVDGERQDTDYLALDPTEPSNWHNIGVALRRTGKPAEAIEFLKKSLEFRADPETISALGVAQLDAGLITEAGNTLILGISQYPDDARIVLNLGLASMSIGDDSRAKVLFEKAIALKPNAKSPHDYLTNLLERGNCKDIDLTVRRSYVPCSSSQLLLGEKYFFGRGLPQSYLDAKSWFEIAAENNNPAAEYYLGQIYFYGLGASLDKERAIEWYERAASKGHGLAQYHLGIYCYEQGIYEEALRYLSLASDQAHVEAKYALGWMYVQGLGVRNDYERGVSLFEAAANLGHFDAQINLAHAYQEGLGVTEDPVAALAWLVVASNLNKEQTTLQPKIAALEGYLDAKKVQDAQAIAKILIERMAEA